MRTLRTEGLITVISVLNVVLIKHWENAIPMRDLSASGVVLGLVVLAALAPGSHRIPQVRRRNVKTSSIMESLYVHRVMSSKMLWLRPESMFMLAVPWALILLKRMQHEEEAGYLLVPHLQFFQSQILGEAILFAANKSEFIYHYTCLTNAYRALPLGTWLLRSLSIMMGMQSIESWDLVDFAVLLVLPALAFVLWAYETFVSLPIELYPTTLVSASIHDPIMGNSSKSVVGGNNLVVDVLTE